MIRQVTFGYLISMMSSCTHTVAMSRHIELTSENLQMTRSIERFLFEMWLIVRHGVVRKTTNARRIRWIASNKGRLSLAREWLLVCMHWNQLMFSRFPRPRSYVHCRSLCREPVVSAGSPAAAAAAAAVVSSNACQQRFDNVMPLTDCIID